MNASSGMAANSWMVISRASDFNGSSLITALRETDLSNWVPFSPAAVSATAVCSVFMTMATSPRSPASFDCFRESYRKLRTLLSRLMSLFETNTFLVATRLPLASLSDAVPCATGGTSLAVT